MKGPPVCLLWRERKVGFFHFLSFFKKGGMGKERWCGGWKRVWGCGVGTDVTSAAEAVASRSL